jgi:hypothetical protein
VLLSTPLQALFLDLHHLLNVHVQLANKMGLKQNKKLSATENTVALCFSYVR